MPRHSYRQQYTRNAWLSITVSEPCSTQNPHLSALAKLSTQKEAIIPLSFSPNCLLTLRCTQPGDGHNRVIRSRMAANRSLDTPPQPTGKRRPRRCAGRSRLNARIWRSEHARSTVFHHYMELNSGQPRVELGGRSIHIRSEETDGTKLVKLLRKEFES